MYIENKYDTQPELPPIKKIVFFRGDKGGCWGYRGHFPFNYIHRNYPNDYGIAITGVLDRREMHKFDLAIFQRQYKSDVFSPMLEMKKKHGVKLVYEIDDDLFNVPKWSTAFSTYGKRSVKENIKHFLSEVDAMFVATERLKDVYSPYCEKIYVLENSIAFDVFHPNYTGESQNGQTVLLWYGSNTHLKDMSIVKPALQKLAKRDDVTIKLWQIDLGIPNTYQVPFVQFEDFFAMLSMMGATIGICPLCFVPFNRGKSALKFMELNTQGIPVVASNFGPYKEKIRHEETGLLVDDNREWLDYIEYLIDNPDIRQQLVQNAQAEIREKYDISKNYILWKNAIDEILES